MRIYLAGIGVSRTDLDVPFLFKNANIFLSFFDVDIQTVIKSSLHRPNSIIIDSGAYAFLTRRLSETGMANCRFRPAEGKAPNPFDYLRRYVRFAIETAQYVERFVELDIVDLEGPRFQKYQRDALREAVGPDKLIPVWHACETIAAFQKLAERETYIGTEGPRTRQITISQYRRFTDICRSNHTKLHVFAAINRRFLGEVPCYSVDASTFSNVWRFGTALYFNARRGRLGFTNSAARQYPSLNHLGHMSEIKRFRGHRGAFLSSSKIVKAAVDAYQQLEKYMTAFWSKRGIIYNKNYERKKI